MAASSRAERGFTLIEVTLAIVIGVVVIAGATVLYQQAKRSAGNTAAQQKTMALGAIIEAYAARAHDYPNHAQLRSIWKRTRPDDYMSNPWGGSMGANGTAPGVDGIAMGGGPFSDPWTHESFNNPDYAGVTLYYKAATGAETKVVTDYESETTRTYRGYVLGIFNQDGFGPYYVVGQPANTP